MMTLEQITDIALRGLVNPSWLTDDEILALALLVPQEEEDIEVKN